MAGVKRIAIVGVGSSGLAATKICLEEGLEPVAFERTDEVGGLWRFTDKVRDGQSVVMKSTVSNASKEMSCFSDFPMPKEFPNFLHHSFVHKYFRSYADHFQLDRHIRYNTEVTSVRRAEDYIDTGRWIVESTDHKTGALQSEQYDAVLVCSGHHAHKHVPQLPGLQQFKGQITHSHDYRPDEIYQNKRILVMGFGNSAGDLAVELSRIGSQVFLSTRKGSWIFHNYLFGGMPWDLVFHSPYELWKNSLLPFSWSKALLAAKLNQCINHDLYGLTPESMPLSHSPFINDELLGRIICGAVTLKDDVKCFSSGNVEFLDGSCEDIDIVVMATGYIFGFPFVEKEVIDVQNNQLMLYKQMFQPDLLHQTLAFMGCVQPSGSIWPATELQSRAATAVFKGTITLPSRELMWKDIEAKAEYRKQRYPNTIRHTLELDWLPYMNEVADMIGCKPNYGGLLFSDPKLALKMFFGPCVPYQFRLQGPGRWSGAREAILTVMDRVRFPLQSRSLPAKRRSWLIKTAEWIFFPSVDRLFFMQILLLVLFLLVLFS